MNILWELQWCGCYQRLLIMNSEWNECISFKMTRTFHLFFWNLMGTERIKGRSLLYPSSPLRKFQKIRSLMKERNRVRQAWENTRQVQTSIMDKGVLGGGGKQGVHCLHFEKPSDMIKVPGNGMLQEFYFSNSACRNIAYGMLHMPYQY